MNNSWDWNFVLQIIGVGIAVVLIVVILWAIYKMITRKGAWKGMMPQCMMDKDCGQARILILNQQQMVDALQGEIAVKGNQQVQEELEAAQRGLDDAKEMKDDIETLRARYLQCQASQQDTVEMKATIRALEDQRALLQHERDNFRSSYNKLKASVESKGIVFPAPAPVPDVNAPEAEEVPPPPPAMTDAVKELTELETMASAALPPVAPPL